MKKNDKKLFFKNNCQYVLTKKKMKYNQENL